MVLVIIGGLFSYAVLSLKRGDMQATVVEEVRRVAAYLQAAQEEAILKHRELALRFERERYSFLQLEEGKWVEIEGDEVFKPYLLPKQLRCQVEVLDGSIPLADDTEAAEALVLILSSGEVSPFELSIIATDGNRYALRSDFMGGTQMYDPDSLQGASK